MRTRLIRFLTCALIAGATFEICVRVDDQWTYGAPVWASYSWSGLFVPDRYGLAGTPNTRFRKWVLNSLGLRGPELLPGRQNILCLGASETYGLYESEGMEYPRQLEQKLKARFGSERYQVVNGAYPGERLSTTVGRLPKLLNQTTPSIALIYPSLVTYSAPAPAAMVLPQPILGLRLPAKLGSLIEQTVPIPVRTLSWRARLWWASRNVVVMRTVPETHVERFQNDLQAVLAMLRERGVRPILITHATRFGAGAGSEDFPFLIAWRRLYPTVSEEGLMDLERRLNEVMRETSGRQGVRLIDAAKRMPPGSANFADSIHFNDRGAGEFASLVGAAIMPPAAVAQATLQN